MKLRVLHLIDSLKIGGAEMLLRDLARGLLEAGHEVHVGYSTPGPLVQELRARGIPTTHLPRLARLDPLLFLHTCRLIRRVRPHIVHTHLFKSDFHGRPAARLCRVPIVISTLHNVDAWARVPPLGALYGLNARLADRLIAVSEEVRRYHILHSRLRPEQVIVIENGVDVQRFAPRAEAREALRAELGIPREAPLIGTIGRLTPQKDPALFLQAAARLRAVLPEVRFLVVGDGPLREELQSLAHALELDSVLTFGGLRNDIPAVLAALDILVFASRWEGLPVALLEGMAAGKAIVATAVGGIPDVGVHGVNMLLIPPADSQALAQACLHLLRDPSLARRLGCAARALVEERYSLRVMLQRTLHLYETLWNAYETATRA